MGIACARSIATVGLNLSRARETSALKACPESCPALVLARSFATAQPTHGFLHGAAQSRELALMLAICKTIGRRFIGSRCAARPSPANHGSMVEPGAFPGRFMINSAQPRVSVNGYAFGTVSRTAWCIHGRSMDALLRPSARMRARRSCSTNSNPHLEGQVHLCQ